MMVEQQQFWIERKVPSEPRPCDRRDDFERDAFGGMLYDHAPQTRSDHRARIIHSAAFRRLQAKTQVLGITEGDFHRTRLTHSMEAAQIGSGIVRFLRGTSGIDCSLPSSELIEAICFAHDLGHPPFGHGGEIALNYAMWEYGGSEGNGQTLRILSKVESHTNGWGLNLTRRTLLGVLKYPVFCSQVRRRTAPASPTTNTQLNAEDWKPLKCYLDTEQELVGWILEPFKNEDQQEFSLYSQPTEKTR